MRVIAGSAKGRKLISVAGEGTRPITGRVKTALFSILGPDVEDAAFLDLFAGTGSVGIEALSRGARHVVFVERARKAMVTVRKNLETTGMTGRAELVQDDAFRYLHGTRSGLSFDYIYVAPPQYKDIWTKALLAVDSGTLLADDGVLIVQIHPKEARSIILRNLQIVRERRYGTTLLQFYAWARAVAALEAAHTEEATGDWGEPDGEISAC